MVVKKTLSLVLVIIASMLFCKTNSETDIANLPITELIKIEYLHHQEVLFSSEDKSSISKFVQFLLTASHDTTGVNYKSLEFIKFYDSQGKQYRIGVVENRFVAGGRKYIIPTNIKDYFELTFETKLP